MHITQSQAQELITESPGTDHREREKPSSHVVNVPSEVPAPRKVPLGLMSNAVMGAAKLFVLVCRNTSISPTSV